MSGIVAMVAPHGELRNVTNGLPKRASEALFIYP
jgi:hypothetical protein